MLGFGLALAAIWLVSIQPDAGRTHWQQASSLGLPLLAGLGFGAYFVIMHHFAREATLWPMVASRSGGMGILVCVALLGRRSLSTNRGMLPWFALNGVLDVGGNLFFILAGQAGRLDIAAVLSSLYPGSTVILAWLILKERISPAAGLGILLALAAIALMTF